ncbi:SGT1-like protein [Purpureocillium lilacinum]|uniref:SGT1-like protein n=1 Tax=Purpureocillium lilacinum TaxID=33203 RepID=A0A179HUK3_PURLI|nr:SGT1-like protein [Purpureocillium lilacinum]OAQ93119.1 SGT1-like protein [Purpureocillium lilacinum]
MADGNGNAAPGSDDQRSGDTGPQSHLPDNSVEYCMFLLEGQVDARRTLSNLESLRKSALELAQTLTADYIWQRDDFNLELKITDGLRYLYGVTEYGDAVEDEWLVVYILRELTRLHPTLWARAADTDGEFLLIEAANVLPPWLGPEMDQNRVWMHKSNLLVIPTEDKRSGSSSSGSLPLPQAVDYITSKPDSLVQSPFIEAEAFYRLEKYPRQISQSAHHSIITIPRRVAYILHEMPRSIAPAVEAFYHRDAIDLRSVMAAPETRRFKPDDMVTVSVRFSRVLFAQLKSQRFEPPPGWQHAVGAVADNERSMARLDMGMKLTCGFEILARDAEKNGSRSVRQVGLLLDDLEEDGDATLPQDKEIESWHDNEREDDDSWMDINYEDFERELSGQRKDAVPGATDTGFGSAQTKADLRKIVSRFESFLNDERAGLDGAEIDDVDDSRDEDGDDDDDELSEEDSEFEDKEVGFDEEAFSNIMREMMGMPANVARPANAGDSSKTVSQPPSGSTAGAGEGELGIEELSAQMEAELRGHGALRLDTNTDKRITTGGKGKDVDGGDHEPDQEASEDSDGEIDVDYNLARNLLESFKGQAGASGPAGNIMGLMGLQLPRDEGDFDDQR